MLIELLQVQVNNSQPLAILNVILQVIATAFGVGIAAFTLVNKYGDDIVKQIREVKKLTDRNNTNIENRSEEIKIKTDGLYGFIDNVQRHQAKEINGANKRINQVLDELSSNTKITQENQERIDRLEQLIAEYNNKLGNTDAQ